MLIFFKTIWDLSLDGCTHHITNLSKQIGMEDKKYKKWSFSLFLLYKDIKQKKY